jgi:signal transduction histidine kinase
MPYEKHKISELESELELVKKQVLHYQEQAAENQGIPTDQLADTYRGHLLLEAVRNINRGLLEAPDRSTLLAEIMLEARKVLHCAGSSILLLNEEGTSLYFEVAQGEKGQAVKKLQLDVNEGIGGYVVRTGKTVLENLPYENTHFNPDFDKKTRHQTRNIICAPLMDGGKPLGVLQVINSLGRPLFSREDLKDLELFCIQASLALLKHRMLQELQDKNQELAESNRLKSFFLSAVSHELRTPLTPVLAWSGMLSDPGMDDETRAEGIREIEEHSSHLANLIGDLIHLAELDCDQVYVEPQKLNLMELVQFAIDNKKAMMDEKGINLDASNLREGQWIFADEAKTSICIEQILDNAIKFNDSSNGKILLVSGENLESFTLKCTNSGEGIPEKMIPSLCQRFHQVDESRTRQHGGLGIGLSLVQGFMELCGGTVTVESSEENRQTSVTLCFKKGSLAENL